MTKRCGYCRAIGHDKRGCEVMQYKIDMIKKFLPFEKRNILNLLAENGYGDGAIVSSYSWRKGRDVSVMLTSDLLNQISVFSSRFIDYRQIKYSKRVRVTLKSFTGLTPEGYNEEKGNNEIMMTFMPSVYASGMNLEDPSETIECAVFYNSLEKPTSNRAKTIQSFMWERPCELLSPSYDIKIDESLLNQPYTMHERLQR